MVDFTPAAPPPERKKLTLWLIAGGVASLLLPLLAVIYLRITETRAVPGPSGRDLFEHREGSEVKLTPTQVVVIPTNLPASPPPIGEGRVAAPESSSLDFITTNDELRARTQAIKKDAGPPVAPQASPPPELPAVAKTTSKTPAKSTKKSFSVPRLQPSRGFSSFKGGKDAKKGASGQQTTGVLDPQAAGAGGGGQDMSEMLKNLPPGAENDPRIQEYLKNRK